MRQKSRIPPRSLCFTIFTLSLAAQTISRFPLSSSPSENMLFSSLPPRPSPPTYTSRFRKTRAVANSPLEDLATTSDCSRVYPLIFFRSQICPTILHLRPIQLTSFPRPHFASNFTLTLVLELDSPSLGSHNTSSPSYLYSSHSASSSPLFRA